MSNKPIKKIDFDPHVQSAIFENERQFKLDDGSTITRNVLSADLSRRYFDRKDGKWKETTSYTLKELLVHREVVERTIQALIEASSNRSSDNTEPAAEELSEAA